MKYTSAERLNQLINDLGIKQSDFAKATGLPKSAVSMYFSGARQPRQDKLTIIAETFHVDEAWLMGFDVPKTSKELSAESASKDIDLIYKFSMLNDRDKSIIINMIDAMLKNDNN